ncbi:hypothetical protein L1887_11588 [Cichorium endivia]|nr:hypothetical protein L1887_11588 [Cichorium endivia]
MYDNFRFHEKRNPTGDIQLVVFHLSCHATITTGDIQLIVHTMLSPMLRREPMHSDVSDSEADSIHNYSKTGLRELPLNLVDGNNSCFDLSVGKERTVRLPLSSMSILISLIGHQIF